MKTPVLGTEELEKWLLENGGPTVKLRLSSMIPDYITQSEVQQSTEELLRIEKVNKAFNYFDAFRSFDQMNVKELYGLIHNCYDNCFEMFIRVLFQLGFHNGIPELDEKVEIMRPVYACLMDKVTFYQYIIIKYLLKMGYDFDDMIALVKYRISQLHRITQEPTYDIYRKKDELPRSPKWMEDKLALKDEYSPYLDIKPLPLRQDIEMILNLPKEYIDSETQKRIDDIITFILPPEYQALRGNYGWLWNSQSKTFNASNEGFHIPLSVDAELTSSEPCFFLSNVSMMAKSSILCKSVYFEHCMEHIESFKTERGTYLFPESYLYEADIKSGYFAEAMINKETLANTKRNDKKKLAMEIYSTLLVVIIKRTAN